MKTIMTILNTATVCYCIYLASTYDPLTAAINRAVLEVVAGLV
jgi:hypothetical protein